MTGCTWMAQRLPHIAHDDCAGLLPELATGLQNLMDHQARSRPHGRPAIADQNPDVWGDQA